MRVDDKALKSRRPQHDSFETRQECAAVFEPPQHRWPSAGLAVGAVRFAVARPMTAGSLVVLDVKAVVEEQRVVQASVMAARPVRVFVVAVYLAQGETNDPARQIYRQEHPRRDRCKRDPQTDDEAEFSEKRRGESKAMPHAGVMAEVTALPQLLRDAEHETQPGGVSTVHPPRAEERPMDEVVRDRIGVPPQRDRHERDRRSREQQHGVQNRQGDEGRVPEDATRHARDPERG